MKVAVVGAGPAGVSAAYFLKAYDRDNAIAVDLIERLGGDNYSRYHDMCGEAVSDYLFTELKPLKPDGIVEKIRLIREYWPGNIEINTRVNGCILDRAQFLISVIDKFKKAGGIFENRVVEAINQKDGRVTLKFKEESREYDYVIAADGANSQIREFLGIRGNSRYCIQYIIDKEPEHGTLIFYYDKEYEGDYKWVFPHGDNTKVGYPLITGRVFKPDEQILTKQTRAIGYGGIAKYLDGRILLIGDAACQTNALTKGGIRPGMFAGKLAAKAIINENPKQYETEWLKTKFSSKIFITAFKKLSCMDNDELREHMEPFSNSSILLAYLKCQLSHREYRELYSAYKLSGEVGW
jgi:flavin-dependent dehydrogenase